MKANRKRDDYRSNPAVIPTGETGNYSVTGTEDFPKIRAISEFAHLAGFDESVDVTDAPAGC